MTKAIIRKNIDELQEQMHKVSMVQDDLILKVQTRKKFEYGPNCAPIDFKTSSKIEYLDGVFITDLTTDEQIKFGINIFKINIEKTVVSPEHLHSNQTQLLHVIKGSIYDEIAKVRFDAGASFFMAKNTTHKVKYLAGSELIAVYIPSLTIITEDK